MFNQRGLPCPVRSIRRCGSWSASCCDNTCPSAHGLKPALKADEGGRERGSDWGGTHTPWHLQPEWNQSAVFYLGCDMYGPRHNLCWQWHACKRQRCTTVRLLPPHSNLLPTYNSDIQWKHSFLISLVVLHLEGVLHMCTCGFVFSADLRKTKTYRRRGAVFNLITSKVVR